MDFDDLAKIEDEAQRVAKTYEIFDEETRLTRSKAAAVEFLTTVKYIEEHLRPGDKILDLGAGTGAYSLYLAKKGHSVTAVELSEANLEKFRPKITPELDVSLRHGNALDLSMFEDGAFDLVLLLGPLYHLEKEEDRRACIREAMRVCRPGGAMFFSFISNDMVILTEFDYRPDFFSENTYDHESFKVFDFPFVFLTVDQSRKILERAGVKIIAAVASDGVSELMAEKINALDGYGFAQYLKYHFYCCEKPEMLGRSNHLLYVGKKPGPMPGKA